MGLKGFGVGGREVGGVVYDEDGHPFVAPSSDHGQTFDRPYGYDISTISSSQTISTEDFDAEGITWNNDGSKLYEIGSGDGIISEFSVSTPFDISTATVVQSISTEDTAAMGLAWNNDGSKFYEVGNNSNKIYEYEVSSAFDISTATVVQSISTQDGTPQGICWNNDGSKLYEVGRGSNLIYEYNVSEPFDISTATFNQSINAQDRFPRGIVWNNDGSVLHEAGNDNDSMYRYAVSTPFDISTASFIRAVFTPGGNPHGIAWNNDGSKLYEIDDDINAIYEHEIGTAIGPGEITALGNQLGDYRRERIEVATAAKTLSQEAVIQPFDTSGGGFTITLDSSLVNDGVWVEFSDENGSAGANALTIDTSGTATINGATSVTINSNYGAARLYTNGTDWFSVATAGGVTL